MQASHVPKKIAKHGQETLNGTPPPEGKMPSTLSPDEGIKGFILHVRAPRKLRLFFVEEGGLGASRTRAFSVEEKYLMPYTCSIQRQRLYRFRHQGCWDRRSFGPYFRSQLTILQCSKRQGPCLLHMSNANTPHSSEFYGDVLHERITHQGDTWVRLSKPWATCTIV